MPVTVSTYNETLAHLAAVGANSMVFRLQLLNNSAAFNATHTALTSVNNSGAHEVSGNGWTAGGVTLTGSVAVVTTNDAILDYVDVSVEASGGAIGPAHKAVIYDDAHASDKPLFFIDFGEAKTADAGTDFKFTWSADGILKISI